MSSLQDLHYLALYIDSTLSPTEATQEIHSVFTLGVQIQASTLLQDWKLPGSYAILVFEDRITADAAGNLGQLSSLFNGGARWSHVVLGLLGPSLDRNSADLLSPSLAPVP